MRTRPRPRILARSPARAAGALLAALAAAGLLLVRPALAPEEDEAPRKMVSFEEDDGVKRALSAAEEHEKAGRWREALAQYRRALAKNPDHLCLLKDGKNPARYAGTPEYVLRRVAGWPPEGLAAYRAEYDAPAQGLFEAWRKDGDPARLEAIVSDYFFSSLGDDAAHLLAVRLFDAGRVAEAAATWDRILRYYPGPSVPPGLVAARLMMAARLLGGTEGDAEIRQRLAGATVRLASAPVAGDALAEALGRFPVSSAWSAATRAGGWGAVAPEPGPPGPSRPLGNDVRLWAPSLLFDPPGAGAGTDPATAQALMMWGQVERGRGRPVSPHLPAAARDEEGREVVLVQNGYRITALDPENGRLLWRNPPSGPTGDRRLAALYSPAGLGCVAEGRRVYANMMLPAAPAREGGGFAFGFRGDALPVGPRTIRCYDIPTGRLVWDAFGDARAGAAEGGEGKEAGRDPILQFPTPVAVGGGRVYAAATVRQNDNEVYVCALRADTGALLWKRYLCSAPASARGFRGIVDAGSRVPCVAESGGIVYCLTNLGAVAALRGADGRVLWLTLYPAEGEDSDGSRQADRPANPPVVAGARLVVLPQDAAKAFCLDARTGAVEESFGNAADSPYLLGVHPVTQRRIPAAVLAGRRVAFHFLDGSRREPDVTQVSALVAPAGRGVVRGNILHLPMREGLLRYDLHNLKIRDTAPQPWVDGADAGNLVAAGSILVAAGMDRASAYAGLDHLAARDGAILERTPPWPPALLEHGERLFESRRYAEAAETLARGVALLEAGRPADDPELAAARERICRSAIGRAEALIAQGEARGLPAALEALRSASAHARRDDLQAELLLLSARARIVLGAPSGRPSSADLAAAVSDAQEVIERVPGSLVPVPSAPGAGADVADPAARRALSGRVAAALIADWVSAHGRGCYADVEARAARALEEVLGAPAPAGSAPDPAAAARLDGRLAALVARFPNSDAAWTAARRRAPPGSPGAVAALEHYLDEAAPAPDRRAEALFDLADAWGAAGRPDRLRRALETVRRAAPDAAARAAAEDRLAALGPPPEPAPPADLLNLAGDRGQARHRETVISSGAGLPTRACLPEPLPGEAPPLSPDRLLLARGSGFFLQDLETRNRTWSLACPKGDVGFELIDDPSAGMKDTVFIYPGPAGAAAQEAGLKDGDAIVRVDGAAVSPAAARLAFAGIRPGVPLRLDVRRGDKVLALTLVPGAWPEDREPFALPDQAAWLPGGSIAVAWKDRVASVAPADGAPAAVRWVFPAPGGERIQIESVLASRRCVFVRYTVADPAPGRAEAGGDETRLRRGRPVVIRGRVFIGGAQVAAEDRQGGRARETRIAGLDAATGRLLWERTYPAGAASDPAHPDLVLPDEDLLVRVFSLIVPAGVPDRDPDEESVRQQHLVEAIDGRTGRRIGPSAGARADPPVEAMALDREAGWLLFLRDGQDLQVFDGLARVDRKAPLRVSAGANRNSDAVDVALAAAHGRVAVGHRSGLIEIGEPGEDRPLRQVRLAELLGKETGRQVAVASPGALQWDGPGRLVVYNIARQMGYLTVVDAAPAAPRTLWETVETRHGEGGANRGDEGAVPTAILPPTARHFFKLDRGEGVLRCFDKARDGSFAKEIKFPRGERQAGVDLTRILVRGERLIVEAGGEIRVFRK